jgi:formylglycine-generating enzyme required for sulfatase activity
MRKIATLCTLICFLLLPFLGATQAQTPVPPSPTPAVVGTPVPPTYTLYPTYTPYPSPTAAPSVFQMTEKEIPWWLAALLAVVCGVLGFIFKPVFERFGKALVNWLSRLGPGWGFKKQYLTHLIEEHRGLNIRGLKTKAPVTVDLEQVYVSLRAQVPDKALGRQELPAIGIGQAMGQHDRLVVLGGPGTGKTTLLAYLTLTYARGQAGECLGLKEKRLPILVPLRQLKQVLVGDNSTGKLPDYLTDWYAELGLHPREGFFEKALHNGNCLVLLDGLDEVADDAERRQMSEWVDRLVTVYPKNRYVVTSRPPGYEGVALENGFTVLHIRDFTAEEIRQFATNWCLAVELAAQGEDNPTARRRAREAARDMVAAIEANADIRRLAVNPLLLSIIALVHRYRATLPKRRVDLYAECVDVLLGYWDAAKGLVGELSPGAKQAVLQALALGMHQEKRREIDRRELERRIAAFLPAVGGQPSDAVGFVDEVRERSGLLLEMGLDRYAFSHLTFQEYLSARELVDKEGMRGLLLEKAGDDWWQEVTLLYVGMADATPIVEALLNACDDGDCAGLLLAGRCIDEAVRVEEPVRERVTRRLEEQFATCAGELFLRTGQVLAGIAGEDSVDFFLRLARDNPDRRKAALWSLGQMGRQPNEALRDRVLKQLLTRFQEDELSEEAGAVLVQVWGVNTLDELLRRDLTSALLEQAASILADAMDLMMVSVPTGEFLIGDEKRKMHVDAFEIDKYPVTNVQYKRFVDETGHRPPEHWGAGTYLAEEAIHPVVNVSWDDAVAYAEWAGKRLPTEEEWEKAARGTDGRKYPWGDEEPTSDLCNFGGNEGGTTPVGKYSPQGDSPYGCADMAGNVWEWTSSEYSDWGKVLRGGSWYRAPDYVRGASRHRYRPGSRYDHYGFRCARGSE